MYDVIHDAQTHDTKIRMLDIGAGSGYLAVAMALLVGGQDSIAENVSFIMHDGCACL